MLLLSLPCVLPTMKKKLEIPFHLQNNKNQIQTYNEPSITLFSFHLVYRALILDQNLSGSSFTAISLSNGFDVKKR